jgi:hypothetical protein
MNPVSPPKTFLPLIDHPFTENHHSLSKENENPFPEIIFRYHTPSEEFSQLERIIYAYSWAKENGYYVTLPKHPQFDPVYKNPCLLSDPDKKQELWEIFSKQIYQPSVLDHGLCYLKDAKPIVMKGLEKLALLKDRWDFKVMEKYYIILTMNQVGGGSYNSQNGVVQMLSTRAPWNGFPERVILHEIVHIGIEESIVKKYSLHHWEKERLVDLICFNYLKDVIPGYEMINVIPLHDKANTKDKEIDKFVDEFHIIHDLPEAISRFIQEHPRR